jgi:hypothetical protein
MGRFYDGRTALWTVLDEAIWAGNKQAADKMKGMISELYTTQEEKGRQQRSVKLLSHFASITNNATSANLDHDDRRYTILNAKAPFETKKENKDYMKKVWHEIYNGGLEAYFGFLLSLDIEGTGLDLTSTYETDAKESLKLDTMNPEFTWLYEVLDSGAWSENLRSITGTACYVPWNDLGVQSNKDRCDSFIIPKSAIIQSWTNWFKTVGNKQFKVSNNIIFDMLEKIGFQETSYRHEIIASDPVYQFVQGKPRYLTLPSIEEARDLFQANVVRVPAWNPIGFKDDSDNNERQLQLVADLKDATIAPDSEESGQADCPF